MFIEIHEDNLTQESKWTYMSTLPFLKNKVS